MTLIVVLFFAVWCELGFSDDLRNEHRASQILPRTVKFTSVSTGTYSMMY